MNNKQLFRILSTIFILIVSMQLHAQSKKIVGILIDKKYKDIVPLASITNNTTKQVALSNNKGIFKIELTKDHLLCIAAVGYNFDTLHVSEKQLASKDTIQILLTPLTKNLQEVTVRGNKSFSAYQMDSIERRENYFGTRSSKKQTTFSNGNNGVGLGVNLDKIYSKEEKKRSKMIDLYYDMEKEEYINYRFNAVIANKYTNLKNEALEKFVEKNRPTYKWLRQHTTEEDIMYYINEKLKEFKE